MTEYVLVDGNGDVVESGFKSKAEASVRKSLLETDPLQPSELTIEAVEQGDETTDDTNDTMSYNFITNDDDSTDDTQDDDQFNEVGSMWTLGNHRSASQDEAEQLSQSIRQTMDALDEDVDEELMSVLEDASGLVEQSNLSGFECPHEECGLNHSHPDHKHDIRSGFEVSNDFASQMEFVPYCHCGVNELAMLMQFFGYISVPVFADQHEWEGVLEVEPDILDSMYRRYIQDDLTVNRAAGAVANDFGQPESEAVPLGVRDDLKRFFERRRRIEDAANSAPIPQETRNVIEENRDELLEVTSE